VPFRLYKFGTPRPPLVIGAYLTLVVIVRDIPDFGRAARIAGAIIEVHSLSVKVQAANGYLSFAAIVECNACHASSCDGRPFRIFVSHSTADVRISWIVFVRIIVQSSLHSNFLEHLVRVIEFRIKEP
jgi:hypothetical protein